jgi:hypothetical protein
VGFAVSNPKSKCILARMTEATDYPSGDLAGESREQVRHPAICKSVGHASAIAYEDNPYLGDFSRRVAARLASLPEPKTFEDLEDDDELRISWKLIRGSYKLVLGFMVGAVLYGGIVYPLLSELRSPRTSAGTMEGR